MQLQKNHIDIKNIDKARLISLVNKFSEAKILVIGDLILDEYSYGYPERISREAPVLILKYLKSKFVLGGGSNAANNVASLGAQVKLQGLLGDDAAALTFSKLCDESGIQLEAITDKSRFTTTKTRIVSSSSSDPDNGTVLQQQVLRLDREDSSDCDSDILAKLSGKFTDAVAAYDLVLVSDYSNGVFSDSLISTISETCSKFSKKYIVDSNGDLSRFKGAYSLTPNQPDLEAYSGTSLKTEDQLLKSAMDLKELLSSNQLLITRGAKGMALLSDSDCDFIPAMNLSEVFDVSGAGDTVSAAYSLALAVGASGLEAALIGNLAASLVVKKYGTATINQEELLELIESL